MPRTAKSQISFADWELLKQGISLEPFLQTISDFLDDHEEMIEAVRRDLERGLKTPATGRNGLTPSQVLRSFVLKSVKSWDLRELRERIADGYTLRQFTEFYCQPVPKHLAFNRAFLSVCTTVVSTRSRLPSSRPRSTAASTTSSLMAFTVSGVSRCYGMSYAWSLVWSAASKKQFRSGFGGSTIASGWHDVACKKSSE